jgi:hypothetical protein
VASERRRLRNQKDVVGRTCVPDGSAGVQDSTADLRASTARKSIRQAESWPPHHVLADSSPRTVPAGIADKVVRRLDGERSCLMASRGILRMGPGVCPWFGATIVVARRHRSGGS